MAPTELMRWHEQASELLPHCTESFLDGKRKYCSRAFCSCRYPWWGCRNSFKPDALRLKHSQMECLGCNVQVLNGARHDQRSARIRWLNANGTPATASVRQGIHLQGQPIRMISSEVKPSSTANNAPPFGTYSSCSAPISGNSTSVYPNCAKSRTRMGYNLPTR